MAGIIFGAIVITVILVSSFIWITNKAYSRKWDNDSDHTRGQF